MHLPVWFWVSWRPYRWTVITGHNRICKQKKNQWLVVLSELSLCQALPIYDQGVLSIPASRHSKSKTWCNPAWIHSAQRLVVDILWALLLTACSRVFLRQRIPAGAAMTLGSHVLGHRAGSIAIYLDGRLREEPDCNYCFWEQWFVCEWTRKECVRYMDVECEQELDWYINFHEGTYPANWDNFWYAFNRFQRDFYLRFFHKYWNMEDWSWDCQNFSACAISTMRELHYTYITGYDSDEEWMSRISVLNWFLYKKMILLLSLVHVF